jgi:predicted SAM-dependent methyltransferase
MQFERGLITLRRTAASLRRRLAWRGRSRLDMPRFGSAAPLQSLHDTRKAVAAAFLQGDGIEIGALHQPLPMPASARVKYVDRMTVRELRQQYEELAGTALVEIDIIDNGELLTTIGDETQDFVVANHFLEHCQNPILTFQNLFRVLKPSGVVYMAVPDKRFTFDKDRPCTTIEHIMRDFREGVTWSKRQHFEEWSRLVNGRTNDAEVEDEVQRLLRIDYSIHFHVWGAAELLELMLTLQRIVGFELELFMRNGPESILVLRKV